MFDITSDDISRLDDGQLRELIGLLCESELRRRGYSPAAVTWGGDQNAPDGGLDVRVSLAAGAQIDGFIPRAATGFQVKRQDMAPAAISAEMSPGATPKQSIAELAKAGGAYVIVSSEGSTADSALTRRKTAMASAIQGLASARALALDFYDRTRVASWVRDNPGMILWVRRTIGRAFRGWEPYGAWSYPVGGLEAEYLVDRGVTICPRPTTSADDLTTLEGINSIRGKLRSPRSVVRLIGLSGVGKTRLVQALFDSRIGKDELDRSLVFYANVNNGPDPPPISLASDLVAIGTRGILIIDNCASELHARLAEVAKQPQSLISVLTVEYDIRDDQPEDTDVYEVKVASVALIEALLSKRFPHISRVDAQTTAEFSGGNARIAIALAKTVAKGGTLEHLNNDQLFRRLFEQRQDSNGRLLEIAQACALVYSFEGEDLRDGESGELARIGDIVGASADDVYRATAELLRRDLAQRRGVWRAVLPHAIANKLAIGALQNIPRTRIEERLVNGAPERIAKSFSRRLGYLHSSGEARDFVRDWFSANGWLSDTWNLNDFGIDLFKNILPVDPAAGLSAMERGIPTYDAEHPVIVGTYLPRALRSIAYDAALFERAVHLLGLIATRGDESCARAAAKIHTSLFTAYLSGTHASVEQRLAVAKALINSSSAKDQVLGFAALDAMLESTHFSSDYDFQFGARSRDYGLHPLTRDEVAHWYRTALGLAATIACSSGTGSDQAKAVIAANFRGLWSRVGLRDELTLIALKAISGGAFWRDGWHIVKQTRRFDEKDRDSENYARLSELETRLRPVNLVQRVRGQALGRGRDFEIDDVNVESPEAYTIATEKKQAVVQALGEEVAQSPDTLRELLPEIVSGRNIPWHFGVGLARGARDPRAIWDMLVKQFAATEEAARDIHIFGSLLWQLNASDPTLADELLDDALNAEPLAPFFPAIQSAVGINQVGVNRLMKSLELGRAGIPMYNHLALGRATNRMTGASLAAFILSLAEKPGGQSIALDILQSQYLVNHQDRRPHTPELISAARELLATLDLSADVRSDDYTLGGVIKVCLSGDDGYAVARQLCENLLAAFEARETFGYENNELLGALFRTQPFAALDSFFGGSDKSLASASLIVQRASVSQRNPVDQVPEASLLDWANRDPPVRYPALATVVNAFGASKDSGTHSWNPIATALLHGAPDPVAVMHGFISRFRPGSWSGSRASILESHATLLDGLETRGNGALAAFIAEQRAQLVAEANEEREWENRRDRGRDESFE